MSDLYLCACEQFYTAHDPDCPAQRQYLLAVAEIERLRAALQDIVDCVTHDYSRRDIQAAALAAIEDLFLPPAR